MADEQVKTATPEDINNRKIRVYLIARISEEAHCWNNEICAQLKHPIEVFMPQKLNPWKEKHELFQKSVYDLDLHAIKNSHLALMLPEYGRDCAWEAGWYSNSKKPLVVFIDTQKEWLRDWMVKGGIDYVITTNQETYKLLRKDHILRHKEVIFIEGISKLGKAITDIYSKTQGAEND